MTSVEVEKPVQYSQGDYRRALKRFDAAICEAIAVGQAQANRMAPMNVGYASAIFTRMCGHGILMMRAAPLTRWVTSDFEDWDFSAVASHARAILEGYLLFSYLIEEPESEAELQARINVMHMNDCTRRIDLHKNLGIPEEEWSGFWKQQEEIRERLLKNNYFLALPQATQKSCLNGKFLMIKSRDELLEENGFDKGHFDALYNFWSQHTHILPLSFYRLEPNGRGTGLENDAERSYIGESLSYCANVLSLATDKIVEVFPDVQEVRRGVKSTFSPGPTENRPRPSKANKQKKKEETPLTPKQNSISGALGSLWGPKE